MYLTENLYHIGLGPEQTLTQVMSILPKDVRIERLLIFIPGNPGMIHFYRPFLYEVLHQIDGNVGVLGLSQAGHCGTNTVVNVRLEAQIAHKVNFYDLILNHPSILGLDTDNLTDYIVMSHSLGSYLALKSLARAGRLPVTKFIGLFPTIQHLRIGIPIAIRLSARPMLRQSLASLVHCLPNKARETVLNWYCGQSEEVKYLLGQEVHKYRLINNVLALAWDEIKEIRKIDAECHQFLESNSDKISLIFGHRDPYVPKRFYKEMQDSYPDLDIDLASKEVPHDFVFDHNKTLASQVAEKLGF